MTTTTDEILEMLADDMVSHGLVAQCLNQANTDSTSSGLQLAGALEEILATGRVEIGIAKKTALEYVEFVAWKGTVGERIERALDALAKVDASDKEFAYWLCLAENVDRYEGDDG